MTEGILERELGVFFAEGGKQPKDVVEQVVHAVCKKLSNARRVLIMPAGKFAEELAIRCTDKEFQVAAFLDNLKEEGSSIAELAEVVRPADIGRLDFDAVMIATPSISAQEAMREQLIELLPERAQDFHILLDIISSNFDDSITHIVRNIRAAMDGTPVGKRICITTPFLHHNYLKLMRHLKLEGFNVTVIIGNKFLNSSISICDFEGKGFFDYCHVTYCYDVVMPRLLQNLEFDLVHAIATTASPLAIAKAIRIKKCPFIVEYCDFKEILFDREEDYLTTMTRKELGRENDAWKTIFMLSDGVIIKDSPEIIENLSAKHGKMPQNWLQFMSYPSMEFAERKEGREKLSKRDGTVHMLYAGCVINNPGSHPYSHHKSLLDIARSFNSQGVAFTIINAMDDNGNGFSEYLNLAKELPLFNYRFAVPQDRLAIELLRYDIGWFGFDLTQARESKFFLKTTFGSKVFNYLEAGLPILISREFEYMCQWVEEKGIGKGILVSDVDNIVEVISKMNFSAMRDNIAKLLPELSMEKQIGRLVDFYNKVGLK